MSDGSDSPTAAVLTVGDELLLGRTVDTNRSWLSERLNRLGFRVVEGVTVGDRVDSIEAAVRGLCDAAELVIVTGGLGPTHDDLTREGIAAATGAALSTSDAWLDVLEERFRARGFEELPPTNRLQALVPEGGLWFANRLGTAPGLVFPAGDRQVVALPGVPREMRGLFEDHVIPMLRERFGGRLEPISERMIRTSGISESVLAERVGDLDATELHGCDLAFLPQLAGVDLRLTARGDEESVNRRLDAAAVTVRQLVGRASYAEGTAGLAEVFLDALVERELQVAVAESCTGGLILEWLTAVPGASRAVQGGVVAYGDQVKVDQLGVAAELLGREGAVSEAVALAMARGVREKLGADLGISVTGIAGPGGGTEAKPVGTVWFAVDLRGRSEARVGRFPGDRTAVRHRAAQAALVMALRSLGRVD